MAGTIGQYKISFSPDLSSFKGFKAQLEQMIAGKIPAIEMEPPEVPKIDLPKTLEIKPKVETPNLKPTEEQLAKVKDAAGKVWDAFGGPQAKAKIQSAVSALGGFAKKVGMGALIGAGGALGGALTAGVVGIKSFIPAASEASDAIDDFKASMEFSGFSNDEINKAAESAKKFANETEYDLDDLLSTQSILASNGVKDYRELAMALGGLNSAAGGTKDTFKSVALVASQASAQGKINKGDWMQLVNAIPGGTAVLRNALEEMGAFSGSFDKALSKGQISAEELFAAVKKLGMTDIAQEAAKSTTTIRGAIANTQAEIQQGISDVLTKNKDQITNLVNGLVPLFQKALPFISQIMTGLISGASQVLGWISKNANQIFGVIKTIVDALSQAGKMIGAFFKQNSTQIFSVIETIVGALSQALQIIGMLFKQNSSQIFGVIKTIVGALSQALQIIGTFVKQNRTVLAQAGKAILDAFLAALPTLLNFLPIVLDFGMKIIKMLSGVVKWMSKNIDLVKTLVVAFGTFKIALTVVSWIKGIIVAIKGLSTAVKVAGGVIKVFSGLLSMSPAGIAVTAIGAIVAALVYFFSQTEAGRRAWQGLMDGITKGAKAVGEWLFGWCQDIIKGVKKIFGIHSPSKVFRDEVGRQIGAGLGIGLKKSLSGTLGYASGFASDLQRTLSIRATPSVDLTKTGRLQARDQDAIASLKGVRIQAPTTLTATPQPGVVINQEVQKADSLLDVFLQTKRASDAFFARGLV